VVGAGEDDGGNSGGAHGFSTSSAPRCHAHADVATVETECKTRAPARVIPLAA